MPSQTIRIGSNLSYSVPWGNGSFDLGSWDYGYRQSVSGDNRTFSFIGRSRTSPHAQEMAT